MNAVVARLSALALVGLLAISVVALVLTSRGGLSGTEVRAEFADASPLVEGMSVRVSGAVAGSVRKIELTERGTVEVTMNLHDGLPTPRADASAAIRQQDLLGDSYLSLSLGHSSAPLEGPIPRARAIASPRFDEFFEIFAKPARDGAQVLLTELGLALERRGVDLNAAILQLRPGLRAADELLSELRGQNDVLRDVLANSRAITRQVAGRTRDLDRSIVALRRTFDGLADHSGALDAALARLPDAMSAARSTTRRLRLTTEAALPLFDTLRQGAPQFRRAASLLGPFSTHLAATARTIAPTLAATTDALVRAKPALRLTRRRGSDLVAPIGLLFKPVTPIFRDLSPTLFGRNGRGGLAAVIRQSTDPGVDPARTYLTSFLVPTCELFGMAVEPGCLERAVAGRSAGRRERRRPARNVEAALDYLMAP